MAYVPVSSMLNTNRLVCSVRR